VSEEQAGAIDASEETLQELAEGNHRYEQKFGFIFIVNATGKTADEMLEMLRHRIRNTRDLELRIAAQEQLKITKIRLQKLFES
jgi:OHCU decarboxylase